MLKKYLSRWWVALILGIFSILLGFFILVNPALGFETMAILVAVDFLFVGIHGVAGVITFRKEIPGWGWNLIGMIIITLLGISIIVVPGSKEVFTYTLFSAGFLFEGILGVMIAIKLRKERVKGWVWVLILGILTVIMGIILLGDPIFAIRAVDIFLYFALFSYGVDMIVLAITMSKARGILERVEKQ